MLLLLLAGAGTGVAPDAPGVGSAVCAVEVAHAAAGVVTAEDTASASTEQ